MHADSTQFFGLERKGDFYRSEVRLSLALRLFTKVIGLYVRFMRPPGPRDVAGTAELSRQHSLCSRPRP